MLPPSYAYSIYRGDFAYLKRESTSGNLKMVRKWVEVGWED
jgi:hypothetical protein